MSFVQSIRDASPRRQLLVVGGAALIVVIVLASVYFLVLRKPYDVLFTNLRAQDAGTIVGELDRRKIPYRLRDGGATILVPRPMVESTRLNVLTSDLPLRGTVGFELFNKSDMGLTEFAQRINFQRALQGELERTLMTIEEIETARVHLTIPEPSVFRDDRQPAKAAVSVEPRAGKTIGPETVRGIQRLVAATVPGMRTEDVVVLDQHGRVVSTEEPSTVASGLTVAGESATDQFYAARVRTALAEAFPAAHFDVSIALVPSDPQGAPPDDQRQPVKFIMLIAADGALTPQRQASIDAIARQAMGSNSALLEEVIVYPSGRQWRDVALGSSQPTPVVRPATAAPPVTPLMLAILLGGVAAVVALGLAAALWWQGRGSLRRRRDYAREFRTLFAEEGSHADA